MHRIARALLRLLVKVLPAAASACSTLSFLVKKQLLEAGLTLRVTLAFSLLIYTSMNLRQMIMISLGHPSGASDNGEGNAARLNGAIW